MYVFFRHQPRRTLVPIPGIRWLDLCPRVFIMESRRCSVPSYRLWLSTAYLWVQPSRRLFACWSPYDDHVRVWDAQTIQQVGKFPTSSVDGIVLSPSLIRHSLTTDSSLFSIYLTSILAIWIVGKGYANNAGEWSGQTWCRDLWSTSQYMVRSRMSPLSSEHSRSTNSQIIFIWRQR